MIYKNEKLLLSLNSTIELIPEHADRITMSEIMDKLNVRQKAGDSVKLLRNKTASVRIHDMDIDHENQIAILLIHYSDTSISDPVFSELQTGKLRVESKLEGEGIAVSAHLAFSLKPTIDRGDVYDGILEEAPGVTRLKLSAFLNSEFRIISDFTFKFDGKVYESRPKVKLTGKLSKGLEEDLKKGVFSGITLEKYKVKDFMDEESIMETKKSSIQLKIKETPEKKHILENATDVVKSIFRQAKSMGYDNVVVHYRTESHHSRSVNIGTKFEDAMDVVYIKSKSITLKKNVDQCEPKFNNEIVNGMKDMILSIRASKEKNNTNKK